MKFVLCLLLVGMVAIWAKPASEEKKKLDVLLKELIDLEGKEHYGPSKKSGGLQKKFTSEGDECTAHEDCVFPFTYDGVEYDSCTTADNGFQYWCSTSATYNSFWDWQDCSCYGCLPPPDCIFPFTYNNITYGGCIEVDHDAPWCSYAEEYVSAPKWIGWGECSC